MSDLSDHGQYNLSFFVLSFFWTAAPKGCLTLNNTLFPCSHSLCCLTRPPANKPPPGVCDKWLVCLQSTPGAGAGTVGTSGGCENQAQSMDTSEEASSDTQWWCEHERSCWWSSWQWSSWRRGRGPSPAAPTSASVSGEPARSRWTAQARETQSYLRNVYVSWSHHKFEQSLHHRWCLYYRKVFWLPDLLLLI